MTKKRLAWIGALVMLLGLCLLVFIVSTIGRDINGISQIIMLGFSILATLGTLGLLCWMVAEGLIAFDKRQYPHSWTEEGVKNDLSTKTDLNPKEEKPK